jgi:hypothetical protein
MRANLRNLFLAGALSVVPAIAAASGPDTYIRSWFACTPGSVVTCNSISIATTAIMSGSTRIGTSVVVNLHNFSNQAGNIGANTLWASLNSVWFYAGGIDNTGLTAPSLSLNGGATGSGTWTSSAATLGELRLQRSGNARIAGCAPTTPGTVSATLFTCASGSTVGLSFTMSSIFDATSTAMSMQVNDPNNVLSRCYTSEANGSTACNNVTMADTVTPEPMSITLLATGLLGMGGVGLRRRSKKNQA